METLRAERRAARFRPADRSAGPYFLRDGAVHRLVPTRDGAVEIPLCNFSAVITAQTTRDDGAEQLRCFTIEGRHAGGVVLPPVDVPADQFAAMTWVTARWGNRPVVYAGQGTKDHLRTAIQMLSDNPPERTVYGHTGWREVGGRWVYLHAGGAVGRDGPVAGVEVDLGGPLAGFCLPDPPTGADLVAAVRSSLGLVDGALAPDRVTIPLLAAVFRVVLGGVDFAVNLFGRTGVFKSELAALAQQHFGPDMDRTRLPANWASTPNAIEGMAFSAKDAVLVLDDFNPTRAADPQKLHAAADRVFRGAGNGAGRHRLAADLSVRPARPPRALILSTGEDVPRGHSCRARLLVVEVEPGDVDPGRLAACQGAARDGVYARALAGFVRWLAPRYGAVRVGLAAERAAARDALAPGAPHARTPAAAGDLLVGLGYLTDFAAWAGAVTPAGAADLMARGRRAMMGLVGDQADHLLAGDPVAQFLRLVPAVILSGQAHLSAPSGGPPAGPDIAGWRRDGAGWSARGNRIGWATADTVYLDPDATYAEAQRMATTQREPITMGPRTFWKRMYERGLLAAVDTRGGKVRFTARATLGGERVEVLHLHRRTLFPGDPSVPSGPDESATSGPRLVDPRTVGSGPLGTPPHTRPGGRCGGVRRVTPADLLAGLRAGGFTVAATGDRLRVSPASRLSATDRAAIRGHLSALVRLVGVGPCCPRCRRPVDAKRRCWACCDRACEVCGRPTGTAFVATCLTCDVGGA